MSNEDPPVFSDSVLGHDDVPTVELSILSRRGGRDHNEDACGHWHSDRHLCCVVADGAGGHGGGDIASQLAVRHIIENYAAAPLTGADEVKALLQETSDAVIRQRSGGEAQRHMHTTVVSLFIDLDHAEALWGHAGDSRLYLFREGRMLARTRDHSLVQALVEAGMLSAEDAMTHPRRSELQSALGTDAQDLMLSTANEPWVLQTGDVFLLCTDGLWEYVDEAEMSASLARSESPSAWLDTLEALVLRKASSANQPHHDNFSAVAVWYGPPAII